MNFLTKSSVKQGPDEVPESGRVKMFVKPDQAQEWLNRNTRNRPLSSVLVDQYARDMREGRWSEDSDSAICIDRSGNLVNGQHRCAACIRAGVGFWCDVKFGVRPESFGIMDRGRRRTAGQMLQAAGASNGNLLASVATLAWVHEKHGIDRINNPRLSPTATEHEAYAIQMQTPLNLAIKASRGFPRRFACPSVLAFCYHVFAERDATTAGRFFADLKTGADLSLGSPVRVLRERLGLNAMQKAKLPQLEVIALFFKAWQAYCKGKSVKCLKWNNSGKTPEPFPTI